MSLSKQLALLTVLMFVFSMVAVPTNISLAQKAERPDGKVKTEILLNILEKAKERVSDIFKKLEERGITIPEEAKTNYETGLSMVEEAVKLRDEGKHREASEKAIEAMQMFKEAVKVVHEIAPGKPVEAEVVAEKAMGLRVAINRTYSFAERLEGLADKAESEGYNVTVVREEINETRTHLENALTALEDGDVDTAAKELAIARKTIGQAMGKFHKITKAFKAKMAEKFLEKAEERITELKERIKALPIPPFTKAKILRTLGMAEENIKRAKGLIKVKNFKDAINQLERFREKEEESFKALGEEKAEIAKILKEIGKLERTISSFEERIKTLKLLGVDVSEVETPLKNAKNLVKEALTQIKLGNNKVAKEALDKAEETIDNVEDILEQVEEEAEEGVKEKTEERFTQLQEKISKLQEEINILKEKGMDTSMVEAMLQEAMDKFDKARERIEENRPEAAEFYLGMVEKILDKIEELLEHLEEKLSEIEERILELNQTIQELKEELKTLQDKVVSAEEQGVEVSAIKTKLEKIRDLVGKAERSIRERVLEAAISAVSMAEDLIEDAEEALEEKLEMAKERIEAALESLKETIENTEARLEKLEEQGANVSKAKTKLGEVKSLIEQIETKIETGNFKDAWKLLEQAEEVLSEVETLLEELPEKIRKVIKKP